VLTTPPTQEGNEPHQLKIQKKVMFDVSKAKRSVAEAVHYGFQTHLVSNSSPIISCA
jgi:hypothetical protein